MKKIRLFLTLVGVAFLFFPAKAERVNVEKAEEIARAYARTAPRLTARRDFQLHRTVSKPLYRSRSGLQRAVQSAAQQEEPLYYVFTMNGDSGFIIVAGDDVAKPVLGYSDEGTYDESNPNLAYWMGTLAQEIADAIENGVAQDAETKADWDALNSNNNIVPMAFGDYVDPLVKTKWNQGAPYNNLCPKVSGTLTVTGCVATAMAQIMKYHEYPTTRTVTIPGYTTSTPSLVISAITGTTNYNWSDMANTYTSSATGTPANAVATLMFHCGVSVEMNYNTNASGASSSNVAIALKSYFDYNAGIAFHHRDYYTYMEWINLLKTEIRANRPVYYAGHGGDGHAFVCDGYDADDLFHFNWGWGGSSDGYFEVSALNPGAIGIGGGSGGYNEYQEIITGIQPNQGGSGNQAIQLGLSTFSASKASLNSVTESFTVTAGTLTNTGVITIASAYLGVLLCNQDGSYRDYKTSSRNIGLDPGWYYPSYTLLQSGYSLPSNLPAGTYKLYPAYSASSGTPTIIPGANGNRYITVVVAPTGKVTLTSDAVKPDLSLVSLKTVGNLYQDKTGNFEAEITNSGMGDYNSRMSIRLGSQTVATDPVVIPAGVTKTVGFSGNITLAPANNYSLSLWYDPGNIPMNTPSMQLGSAVSAVEVKAVPTEPFKLSLVSASFKSGNSAVPKDAPNLTVEVKNEEGLYDDRVIVFIFPETGGISLGYFGYTNVLIEKGETKSILFNDPIDFLEAGTQYRARAYYYYDGGWEQLGSAFYFTIASPSSDATLKSLVVKDAQTQAPLALSPAFQPATTKYFVTAIGITRISIIGEANHKRAKFTNIENQALNNETGTFNIKVTAEDGTTEKTYTVVAVQQPVLGGTVAISGNAIFGQTLTAQTATLTSTPNVALGALSYQWKRNGIDIPDATGIDYTLVQADISATITVTVTAANTQGSVTSGATSAVAKASQTAPEMPELENKTAVSVKLRPIPGAKYASATTGDAPTISSGSWQVSPEFTGLMPNTTYYFFAYYLETATYEASPVSAGLSVTTMNNDASLSVITADGLTPPFDSGITGYTVTLPCGADNFTVIATPNAGSVVDYLVNGSLVTLPLPLSAPGITTLVIRVTAQDGVTEQDYTIAVAHPFDASMIRTYWNDVLAVNLNANTNGGFVFTGFQWTKNGQPMANETGPYLYFSASPPASDRYSVQLTTDDGQTFPVCGTIQVTPAEAQPTGLLAYPNPARHTVTVENPQWEAARQTDLINLSGNLLRSYPSARIQTLDVSGLPVGLYILRAGAHSVKIIIE